MPPWLWIVLGIALAIAEIFAPGTLLLWTGVAAVVLGFCLAAADLAAWQAWEVTPDYVALLNSSTLHPVSRVAIVSYLERSPHPAAKGR